MIYIIEKCLVFDIWELFGNYYFVDKTEAESFVAECKQAFLKINKKERFRITPLEAFNK